MFWRRIKATAALAAGLAVSAVTALQPVYAARVTPMVADMTTSGTGSTIRIEVSNDEDRQVPFELTMHRGTISETGQVTLEPADDRFVIFPPQAVLEPRSQQVFRIQYIPDPDVTQSEVYYASISQVPVALAPDDARIQMLMRFNVLINVVPPNTNPAPVVEWVRSAERATPVAEGENPDAPTEQTKGIEVRISNSGDRYFGAGQTDWTITGKSPDGTQFTERLSDSKVRETTGLGIVAPGNARVFFVPFERAVDADSVEISFD